MKKVIIGLLISVMSMYFLSTVEANQIEVLDPSLEPQIDDFTDAKISDAGEYVYIITKEHKVYKRFGQGESELTPVDITYLEANVLADGEKFVEFAGGQHVYLGLTNQNRIFSWGTYYYGELGNGMIEYAWVPPTNGYGGEVPPITDFYKPVEEAYEVPGTYQSIKSVGRTIYALTTNGELKVWGNGGFGMQPDLDEDMYTVPTTFIGLDDLNQNEEITSFYVSYFNVAAVTNQNRVLMTGTSSSGLLGNGEYDETTIGDSNYTNPLKGDTVIAHTFLAETDQVTDMVIDQHALLVVNNQEVWAWGKIHTIIDNDFRALHTDLIRYKGNNDSYKNEDGISPYEIFVEPVKLDINIPNIERVISLNQSSQMILFTSTGETHSYGNEYHLPSGYDSDIVMDTIQTVGSQTMYLRNDNPGLYFMGHTGSTDVSKLYYGTGSTFVSNGNIPKTIIFYMPQVYNPVETIYSFKLIISDESGNVIYSTDADDDITSITINDDNSAIPKGLLKEDTTYNVDVYLYYDIDGIKVGPFKFIHEQITTKPPLGTMELSTVLVDDSTPVLDDLGEIHNAYHINVKLDQSFYDYDDYGTALKFVLFEEKAENDCDTMYVDGACLVQDIDISVFSNQYYNYYHDDYSQIREFEYRYYDNQFHTVENGYNIEALNLDKIGDVYFFGLDDSVNYKVKIYAFSKLFGNLIDESNPSLGRDGYLGEINLDWNLSFKLTPEVTIGETVINERGFTLPITEVKDPTEAILRNEFYTEIYNEDDCTIIDHELTNDIEVDGLRAGTYQVKTYYEYNVYDNTGINQVVLYEEELTINPGSPEIAFVVN